MRTSKPVSTVSYNTPDYLSAKLRELRQSRVIQFWAFVDHLPEDDQTKQHIHLYVEPARMVQTLDLQDALIEIDLAHPLKPLGTINFTTSKFGDWYLYALHDPAYLAAHNGQSRKYHYQPTDVQTSDADELAVRVRGINRIALSPLASMAEYVDRGLQFGDYLRDNPSIFARVGAYSVAWNALTSHVTARGGRLPPAELVDRENTPTEPEQFRVDPETGEIDSVPLSAVPVPDKRDK